MEVEAKEGGTLEESLPIKNAIAQPLKVSYPELCQKCADLHTKQVGGPDDGILFLCGICDENMQAGTPVLNCCHFRVEPDQFTTVSREGDKLLCKDTGKSCMCDPDRNPCGKTIASIIEAEKFQEALRAKQIVEELDKRLEALRPARQRPVIIAEESLVSPHEFMDEAIARVNREQRTIRGVVP